MFWHLKVLSTLLCLLLPLQNARMTPVCEKGEFLNYSKNKCEPCPDNQYHSKRGTEISCDNCSTCKKGSEEVSECTPTSDTRCKCKTGFKPKDVLNEEICFCDKGFGLDKTGNRCTKCSNGFFTDKVDSICRKLKECKSGIKIPGNSTFDAVCDVTTEVTEVPKANTKSLFQTSIISSTTSTSTSTTSTTSSPPNTDSFYILWPVMLYPGIILLIGLLYCKVTQCIHNHKKDASRQESVCRKPVEESGEKCLSLLV
ncbi:tumor necrosis factor receptor superfamily member 4-like [Myxocyprinus asiaticus]|uniref:tumor necrosis factor receptor superfamily member 4-like n=1 Tax=Myxocyprinus asiaticus TaxID=70543 RepID=UPI002221DFFB|nr:tumor necrosis factor receptor superfamily member 4-like [Myxocyprinus asiaticus]